MKKLQRVLLLSVLSLGLSYPSLANEGPVVKDAPLVIEEAKAEPVSITSMERDIRSLEEKNGHLKKENNDLVIRNSVLQSQIFGLKEEMSVQKKDSSTVSGADLKELQATLKEILAEQKNANALSERQLVISLRGLRS